MNKLRLRRDYQKQVAESRLEGKHPAPSHADVMLSKATEVIAPDGITTALLLCDVIPTDLHRLAFELWKPIDGLVTNRPTAMGTGYLPRRINRDGIPSSRRGVPDEVAKSGPERQGNLGYWDGRLTLLTRKHPAMLHCARQVIELVDELYAENLPEFYALQRAAIERIPRCRLWDTAFSSVYLAKNFRTRYHRDSGNLPGVMTAIVPTGDFKGGELVLPRWRIGFAFRPGDLLLFNPEEVHGNLPIAGERISAAMYCAGQS